jgi:hypothetical protein
MLLGEFGEARSEGSEGGEVCGRLCLLRVDALFEIVESEG